MQSEKEDPHINNESGERKDDVDKRQLSFRVGAMDEIIMRNIDALCLPPNRKLSEQMEKDYIKRWLAANRIGGNCGKT